MYEKTVWRAFLPQGFVAQACGCSDTIGQINLGPTFGEAQCLNLL